MPPLPELRDGAGEEGTLEVFRKGDPEELGAAQSHVDGAGEVHVQLNGVADGGHGDDGAVVLVVVGKDVENEDVQSVRHHHLLDDAPQDALTTQQEVVPAHGGRLPQPLGGLLIATNGALHHLREEAQEQSQAEEVVVGLNLAPVHVNQVGHSLEGVEGDSDGEQEGGHRKNGGHVEEAQQGISITEEKVAVLEGEEQADVNDHRQQDDAPLLPLNASTDGFPLVRLRQRQLFLSVACGQFQPQPQVVNGQSGKE